MAKYKYKTNKPIEYEPLNKKITVRITMKEYKEIEKIAKSLDIPVARMIRNIAIAGIREAKTMHKIKLLKGAKQLKDFEKAFKEIFFNIKEKNLLNNPQVATS